jgi:hypothetical protein
VDVPTYATYQQLYAVGGEDPYEGDPHEAAEDAEPVHRVGHRQDAGADAALQQVDHRVHVPAHCSLHLLLFHSPWWYRLLPNAFKVDIVLPCVWCAM